MNDKKRFAVALIGVPEYERTIIKSIFKLSLYRAYTYILTTEGDPGQIILVDADDPDALAEWRVFQQHEHPDASTTVVLVTKQQTPNQAPCQIRRPLVATRVLSVLDQIAVRLLADPEPETPSEQNQTDSAETGAIYSLMALVVDDSITIRKQIELELQTLGIRADMAESGEIAAKLLIQNSYDLILLDIILPGVDGYQLCKTIKKNKAIKKTPVIMLTSKSSPFDRIRGALSGCDTYLIKPLDPSSFHKAVSKYLKLS